MKTIYLNEDQLGLLKEMAYPQNFDFDELKAIRTFSGRKRYCDQRLEYISSGSGRLVYKVDDEKVLKLAKNTKGLAQNEKEIGLGAYPYYDCVADVYDYSDDYNWLEMQLASPVRAADFRRLYGIPFKVVCAYVESIENEFSRSRYKSRIYGEYLQTALDIMDSETEPAYSFLYGLDEYMRGERISAGGDLKRLKSYGVVGSGSDERIVVIDYGLDDDIYQNYYRKSI